MALNRKCGARARLHATVSRPILAYRNNLLLRRLQLLDLPEFLLARIVGVGDLLYAFF